MSLFLYDKVICPKCKETFEIKLRQKMIHFVRIGNRKFLKCPHCKKFGLCEGQK